MSPEERGSSGLHIMSSDGDGVRISGSAQLVDIAEALAGTPYPLLAAACEHGHSKGGADLTLGASLAPATACTREGECMSCALSGSDTCAAHDPDSPLYSIIDGGPCRRANRSAVAVALVALEAEVEIGAVDGPRMLAAEDYFAFTDPNAGTARPTDLRVLSVRLPSTAAAGFQRLFVGAHEEGATICLAAVQRPDGDVRLVLGGVSPRPYRVYTSVEEEAMAGGLDEDTIAGLADRALLDADADSRSAVKVDVAAALLRDAIAEIAST